MMADVVQALQKKYPHIQGLHKEDICYATTNRQEAVKQIADQPCNVGDWCAQFIEPNRLVEVALNYGCAKATLIQTARY